MTQSRSTFYKLNKTKFEDLNSCYERERGKRRDLCILSPCIEDRNLVIASDSFWCKDDFLVDPLHLLREEFERLKMANELRDSITIQMPFKVLLDSEKQLLFRHNIYWDETRFGTSVLVK